MMTELSITETLAQPFILIQEDQTKVCSGHQKAAGTFKTHKEALEYAKWWKKQNIQNFKSHRYEIVELKSKVHKLFLYFTHRDNLQDCGNYQLVDSIELYEKA